MSISRRTAVTTLATGITGCLALIVSRASARVLHVESIDPDWRRSLEAVGLAYLHAQHDGKVPAPESTELAALLRPLGVTEEAARQLLTGEERARSVRIMLDFQHARIVSVEGWFLSSTEVAIAVIAASQRHDRC